MVQRGHISDGKAKEMLYKWVAARTEQSGNRCAAVTGAACEEFRWANGRVLADLINSYCSGLVQWRAGVCNPSRV